MPSFFANPFMTPFMPQQPAPAATVDATTTSFQPSSRENVDFQSNPLQSDHYMMQSLQCQEMMQHYIQNLMAAASRLPTNMLNDGIIRVSDDGQEQSTISDDSNRFHVDFPNALPALIQSLQQKLYLNNPVVTQFVNPVPVDRVLSRPLGSSTSTSSSSSASVPCEVIEKVAPPSPPPPSLTSEELPEQIPEACRECSDFVEERRVSCHVEENTDLTSDGDKATNKLPSHNVVRSEEQEVKPIPTNIAEDKKNDHYTEIKVSSSSVASCSIGTAIDNNYALTEMNKVENQENSHQAHVPSVDLPKITEATICKTTSSSASTEKQESSSNANNTSVSIQDECRTSVLIKKQMNEIDKEINRRIQNRNIKKIDEKELAQLLSSTHSCSESASSSCQPTQTVSASSIIQSALPFGTAEPNKSNITSPKPTLEQLRNSFALPVVSKDCNTLPYQALSPAYHQEYYSQQQNQQQLFPPSLYLNYHTESSENFVRAQSQNQSSLSLPTTMEQLTQAAAAALGAIPQSYPQFQPYFPSATSAARPQSFCFPGAQQHVTPQLAAAILQQLQQSQALNMFPTTTSFSFPSAQTPVSIDGSNFHMNQTQGQELPFSMQMNSGIASDAPNNIANNIYVEQKLPPPPPPAAAEDSSLASISKLRSKAPCHQNNVEVDKVKNVNCPQKISPNNWPGETDWLDNSKATTSSKDNCLPEESTNSDAEPIWVMRDSYLKRIQREEDRNNKEILEINKTTEKAELIVEENANETESLLSKDEQAVDDKLKTKKSSKKEVMVHEPAVLIEGVLFRARYLGSTQLLCESRPTKTSRMMQAQEAVARVKAPAGEIQPSTDIDLFISTEKIMVLNTDLQRISDTDVRQDILMDHALRTISYIADIGDLVVLMARRMSQPSKEETFSVGYEAFCIISTFLYPTMMLIKEAEKNSFIKMPTSAPRVTCHVFESDEASFIAQSIGQAFQVAYVEFLRANGIDDPSYLREIDYQEVLNSQELLGDELEMFARKETQKDVVVPKKAGEPLGVVVVESGWGSMLPTVIIANLQPNGAASRCSHLNIGDQIIAINGISLVGLPLASAQQTIKATRSSTAVKLTVVSTPPVVEVRIKRPDTKYQLGFSVQNGVICSLLRGGIAERGGIRVGHRIIEINSQSVVAVPHEKIVNMLASAVGEIHMKTMPTSMFRLLTGQEVPNYI